MLAPRKRIDPTLTMQRDGDIGYVAGDSDVEDGDDRMADVSSDDAGDDDDDDAVDVDSTDEESESEVELDADSGPNGKRKGQKPKDISSLSKASKPVGKLSKAGAALAAPQPNFDWWPTAVEYLFASLRAFGYGQWERVRADLIVRLSSNEAQRAKDRPDFPMPKQRRTGPGGTFPAAVFRLDLSDAALR